MGSWTIGGWVPSTSIHKPQTPRSDSAKLGYVGDALESVVQRFDTGA